MQKNEDYCSIVKDCFPLFSLDLNLSSPGSLKLSKSQLLTLLNDVQNQLPTHLRELPLLILRLQAVNTENDGMVAPLQMASIQVLASHSTTMMVCFEAQIDGELVTLRCLGERLLCEIRKSSLVGIQTSFAGEPQVILLVDDDPCIEKIFKHWARQYGASLKIHYAKDGQQALDYFRTGQRCLVCFMDNQMPHLSGEQTCLAIREYEQQYELPSVPIVSISAEQLNPTVLKACGISQHYQKPLIREDILEVFRHFMTLARPDHPEEDSAQERPRSLGFSSH